MAYTKRNKLERIIDIQNIVLEHTNRSGSTQEWVYKEIIYPTYRISRATFYSYLATNAKHQLREMNRKAEEQLKLF